ncbi:helix-turn-helix domain-containing protein [Streptococcus equi]|uniref:DNA-binding protein n=3 Tax=Streptococcus equi TaxID=1336 RepID=A0A7Z8ZWY1_STRSZ|nr:helix-turn-helix transcriptional regulator [Streptococcus equi]HEL1016104.1 helix-turn-helix transcriptional regulator [Streptococcus equi subsp. ruminatorum]ASB97787.1 transcriptional regulator [Streptococcus equi subsp. equi]KIQ76565.1 DNA-binding protein [Streptococcus equi subsp. zooepidemicus]MBT1194309.1 helix-turn-helix transcriptional regulator [Streptococcus equi subsp. equi]MBT1197015.1 helix-turn-helix transcriptional regulator [Streptococcus equi subsp. equi]
MRWDYGKIYQAIRKSKGLTQEKICGDFLARSTLARIESGQVIPKFDTMIFLLNQLNMTLEEFRYVCNTYHPSTRQDILNQFYNQVSAVNITELEKLRQKCFNYLKNKNDIPISYILDSVEVMISLRKKGVKNNQDLQELAYKIWNSLVKQDTWYEKDLQLLHTILFHFPIEIIENISQKILDSLAKYKDYRNIKSSEYALLTNLSTIYLYHNLKKECEEITLLTIKLARQLKRYDSLGFSQVRLGICRNDDHLINKGLQLLQLTEETELLETLQHELKNYR